MAVEPLQRLAMELGVADSITWDLRFIPDGELPSLFAGATVVAFPYTDIDASGALMTAMRFGKPFVATRVGGFESLLDQKLDAVLVPPGDCQALSTAIASLLTDPIHAQHVEEATRNVVASIPSWSEIARLTANTYTQMRRHGEEGK